MGNSQQSNNKAPQAASNEVEEKVQSYDQQLKAQLSAVNGCMMQLEQNPSFESWFGAFCTQLRIFTGSATAFDVLKKEIGNCRASHDFYKQLKGSDIVADYPQRVKAALNIYQRQWDLLAKSLKALQNILKKIDTVKDAVEDCDYELKKNKPNCVTIQDTLQTLVSWTQGSQELQNLAQDWNKLTKDAEKEQLEWQKISVKLKKELSDKRWSKLGKCTAGLAAVVVVGGIAAAIFCPAIIPGIVVAAEEAGKVLCAKIVLGVVVGGAALAAVGNYALCSSDIDACKTLFNISTTINDKMAQAASNSKQIELMINNLVSNMGDMDYQKAKIDKSVKSQKLARIGNSLKSIHDSLTLFEDECKNLVQFIKNTQKHIATN